jgi:hypothetical protein
MPGFTDLSYRSGVYRADTPSTRAAAQPSLSPDYVHELRKFVETELSNELAYRSEAPLVRKKLSVRIAFSGHASKFVQQKPLSVLSTTHLPKQDWSPKGHVY